MAEFYSARGWEIPPLPWTNLSPPFSDIQDTQVLAGGIVDIDNGSAAALVEASRRFGENWIAEIEA